MRLVGIKPAVAIVKSKDAAEMHQLQPLALTKMKVQSALELLMVLVQPQHRIRMARGFVVLRLEELV